MNTLWIVVANHSTAKIFERANIRSPLRLLHILEDPSARKKNSELTAGRPGRHFGSVAMQSGIRMPMGGKHGYSDSHQEEKMELDFAREIAKIIQSGRSQNEFDALVLLVESQLLGALRNVLDRKVLSMVLKSESVNLIHFSDSELETELKNVLNEIDFNRSFLKSG